jgi:hypothetical protein
VDPGAQAPVQGHADALLQPGSGYNAAPMPAAPEAWTVINTAAAGSPLQGLLAGSVAHLTGFTQGMTAVAKLEDQVITRLNGKQVLTWGGDHYNATGFTSVIPAFLTQNPSSKVIAFRSPGDHTKFQQSWNFLAQQNPGRFYIVEVDVNVEVGKYPTVSQEAKALGNAARFFLQGRLAVKMCGTQRVVALGGGGLVAQEMKCGVAEGAQWTIFALSRGKHETVYQGAGTLCDEAALNPNVELVLNICPNEAQAFAKGIQPAFQGPHGQGAGATFKDGVFLGPHGQGAGQGFQGSHGDPKALTQPAPPV